MVPDMYLDNRKLDQVSEFPYLGSMITPDGKDSREIKTHTRIAKIKFGTKSKLFISKKLNLTVKYRLMKTCVC